MPVQKSNPNYAGFLIKRERRGQKGIISILLTLSLLFCIVCRSKSFACFLSLQHWVVHPVLCFLKFYLTWLVSNSVSYWLFLIEHTALSSKYGAILCGSVKRWSAPGEKLSMDGVATHTRLHKSRAHDDAKCRCCSSTRGGLPVSCQNVTPPAKIAWLMIPVAEPWLADENI